MSTSAPLITAGAVKYVSIDRAISLASAAPATFYRRIKLAVWKLCWPSLTTARPSSRLQEAISTVRAGPAETVINRAQLAPCAVVKVTRTDATNRN